MAARDSSNPPFLVCYLCHFAFLIIASLTFVLFLFIFFLIFAPKALTFTVTGASLNRFDYNSTANNTLFYNMALNITIRNPNKKVGLYFNRIQALSYYGSKRFSKLTLTSPPFYQGHKNTTNISTVIEGQQLVLLKKKELNMYNRETNTGIYSIQVKFALRLRARYGKIETGYYKPEKLICNLKVPLLHNYPNGTSSTAAKFNAFLCGYISSTV